MPTDWITSLLSHGASGALGFSLWIIWNLIKNRGKEKSAPYRQDFLEKLGNMLQTHTDEIKKMSTHLEEQGKVILAVDDNNWPKTWGADSPMAKRTHQNVNTVLETQEEMAKNIAEINRKVA